MLVACRCLFGTSKIALPVYLFTRNQNQTLSALHCFPLIARPNFTLPLHFFFHPTFTRPFCCPLSPSTLSVGCRSLLCESISISMRRGEEGEARLEGGVHLRTCLVVGSGSRRGTSSKDHFCFSLFELDRRKETQKTLSSLNEPISRRRSFFTVSLFIY